MDPPSKEEIQKYWGGLFGKCSSHNTEAKWLESERKEMEKVENQIWEDITTEAVTAQCKKLANWKGPGPDKV